MFEHGLCSCVGGLDHAHLHFIPTSNIKKEEYIHHINTIFKERGVGIKKILFEEKILHNIEDIQNVMKLNFKFKILSGEIKTFNDLKKTLIDKYPFKISEFAKKNQPYNLFINDKIKFITNLNIGTQLGREISFKSELNKNITPNDQNSIKNEHWKWQVRKYDQNIIDTIKSIKIFLLDNKFTDFDFKISYN